MKEAAVLIYSSPRMLRIGLPITAVLLGLAAGAGLGAQSKKDFAVTAHKYGYRVEGSAGAVTDA